MLEQRGAVYGAAMEPDLTVRHLRITHTEDLPRLMGSKYVQSRMGDCFTKVRLDLEQGRKVLFSGTGCPCLFATNPPAGSSIPYN